MHIRIFGWGRGRAAAISAFLLALLAAASRLGFAALEPDPAAPVISRLVVRFLEEGHYAHHDIDDGVSRQMLRNYIEFFDYNHMVLDKADVDEFEAKYNDTLDDRLKAGDVSPAFEIFERVKKRLDDRVALVKQVIASSPTFTADESYPTDRGKATWPATPEETAALWKLRVKFELLQEKMNGVSAAEQVKVVNGRYDQVLRTFREYDSSSVLQTYLSALTHSFDPHTDYMADAQAENFNISMRLSLMGIGAVLRSDEGFPKIVSLVPGGPADVDQRLKPNDRIEAVAQGDGPFMEVMGMNLNRVVQLIRGEKGTTVRLKVIPADALDSATHVVIALVRAEIKLTEQEAKAKIITAPGPGGKTARVGVIDLPSFYFDSKGGAGAVSTSKDVLKLLTKLKAEHIDGLILDLRRNGGGSLTEAVALTGLFIPQGPVVQVKDTRGRVKVLEDTDPTVEYSGPMLVLTSRASASASEILAGAMQDYGRAVILGEKSTFGKGTVQSMLELAQYMPSAFASAKPGSLKLTIQKFYRVSGASTQNRGVIPDVRLPALSDESDYSESSQKSALPYDEIDPAGYQRVDLVTPKLAALKKASAERVASSREFGYVLQDIELFKKRQEAKIVSLNEAKRLEEKKAREKRVTERKKARLAQKSPFEEGPLITLASIDGKPPPPKPAPPAKDKAKEGKGGKADGEADKGADYEKAPPAPDLYLQEGVNIVADLAAGSPSASAQGAPNEDAKEKHP